MTVKARTPGGAVSCESKVASEAGAQVLREGGSAVDAIICMAMIVDTVASYHSGMAGGGFALLRDGSGAYESLDFRVCAPAAAKPSMFTAPNSTTFGGLSVAVPGQMRGFEAMHNKHGKLPWARLFEPSIKLAEEGYVCGPDTIRAFRKAMKDASLPLSSENTWIPEYPELAKIFAPGGKLLQEGDIIKRPAFAQTLRTLAVKGPNAFYQGELAQGMVETCQKAGGVLTLEDLASYKARYNDPLSISYKGRKVVSCPAPASGAVLLLALQILGLYDKPSGAGSGEDAHRMVEALKFAYANRTLLGDPSFLPGMKDTEKNLVSEELAKKYFAATKAESTQPADFYYEHKLQPTEDHGTSHFTAADGDGLVISMTTTITLWWGSRLIVPSSGIVLSDGMEDFSVATKFGDISWGYDPSPANFIVGGKRTLSSQCPFIIENEDGSFCYAGGAAGGSKILSGNIQHARNVLDYGMGPVEALDHPRLHDQISPNACTLEPRHESTGIAEYLSERGHNIVQIPTAATTACALGWNRETGKWEAAGEPRLYESGGVVL